MGKKGGNKRKAARKTQQKNKQVTAQVTDGNSADSTPITSPNQSDYDERNASTEDLKETGETTTSENVSTPAIIETTKEKAAEQQEPSLQNVIPAATETIQLPTESTKVEPLTLNEPEQTEEKLEATTQMEKATEPEGVATGIQETEEPKVVHAIIDENKANTSTNGAEEKQEPQVLVVDEVENAKKPNVVEENIGETHEAEAVQETTQPEVAKDTKELESGVAAVNEVKESEVIDVAVKEIEEPVSTTTIDESRPLDINQTIDTEHTKTEDLEESVDAKEKKEPEAVTVEAINDAKPQDKKVPEVVVDSTETQKENIDSVVQNETHTQLETSSDTIRSRQIDDTPSTATINSKEITSKGTLRNSKSVSSDKGVTKRKSQILSLFKRGGDKSSSDSNISEKKKLSKRKSWMFWKSSSVTA